MKTQPIYQSYNADGL